MSFKPAARVLAVFMVLLALNACAAQHQPEFVARSGPPSPSPTPSSTPTGQPTPTPTVKPRPKSLEWYVAKAPAYEPVQPHPVKLPANGLPPFWLRVPTQDKVAFITIDDGALAQPAAVPDFIRDARIPVTMFLNSPAATEHTDYFKAIEAAGGVVENHTIHHTSLRGMSYAYQKQEICGSADKLEQLFGKRPTLFRPPFGDHDDTTIRAARDCGAEALFYWTETVDKGIVRYQTPDKRVQPGDVLLMHFRPRLMDDLLAALRAIHQAGLTPALIRDYL
ncbi:polysaccharide deacetylase family protein [Asanoa sp. NPDC049518]|uniref:polysaccharide deacetylase family protein n=1 Tax=unclassified Asanoa TaxID=2685164 RepID=UPI0034174F5B